MENLKTSAADRIDLMQLVVAVIRKWIIILVTGIITATIAFSYANFYITPLYRAQSTMLVDLRTSMSENLSSEKINIAEKYSATIAHIMKMSTVLQPIIDKLGLDESTASLASKIQISEIDDSLLLKVTIHYPDQKKALEIIRELDKCAEEVINEEISASNFSEIEAPTVSSTPVSPNVTRYTMLGFVGGIVSAVSVIVVIILLNNRVKSLQELQATVDLPVLGVIPDTQNIQQKSKGV